MTPETLEVLKWNFDQFPYQHYYFKTICLYRFCACGNNLFTTSLQWGQRQAVTFETSQSLSIDERSLRHYKIHLFTPLSNFVTLPVNDVTNRYHFWWGIPGTNFYLIPPSLPTPIHIIYQENVYTRRVKLWNTTKLVDKDKSSWYWNYYWVLAKEIPHSLFHISLFALLFSLFVLDYFTSGTFFRLLVYAVLLKMPSLPDMFPKYFSTPRPSNKRKSFLQKLRTCSYSIEVKSIWRSSSFSENAGFDRISF